jgi:hypothetical protein
MYSVYATQSRCFLPKCSSRLNARFLHSVKVSRLSSIPTREVSSKNTRFVPSGSVDSGIVYINYRKKLNGIS